MDISQKINIILLNAKAGAGKDTYYREYKARESTRENICRFAYADAIKELMVKFFGWDTVNKEGIWRTRMQKIGQYFRDLDKNVWVDYVAKEIYKKINCHMNDKYEGRDLTIFITDCRFDNEVIRIKQIFDKDKDVSITVRRLHREFESRLTTEQMKDVSELGISSHLVDEEIYLKDNTKQER